MLEGDIVGGRYAILAPIASGGMGEVYRARHTVSQRLVALKVLRPQVQALETAMARFRQEASAAANIGHEGIVDVLDAGICEDHGSFFIAMELLDGDDLRRVLQRNPARAMTAVLEALHPLAALHQRGFVHRDLKPENIFLATTPSGAEVVKILDFGIARSADMDAQTRTGASLGTPGYMAPEQVESARHATAASDVWAVGVMLYEALAGALPFEGPTPQAVMIQACRSPHEPIADVADVEPGLAAIIEACLAKAPSERPPDAVVLRQQLARLGLVDIAHEAEPSPTEAELMSHHPIDSGAPTVSASLAFGPTMASDPPRARTTGAVVHTPAPPAASTGPRWPLAVGVAAVVALAGLAVALRPVESLNEQAEHGGFTAVLDNPKPTRSGMRRIAKNYWSVDLPAGWGPARRPLPANIEFIGTAPEDDTWAMQPTIQVQVDRFEQTLPAYVILGEHNMEAGGATINERLRDDVGLLPGAGVDVSFTTAPRPFRMMNRATVAGGFGYHVDCMGAEEDWERLRPLCVRILDTFWVRP